MQLMRSELLRMLAWQVGLRRGYTFSIGKNYKFLPQYLEDETREALYSISDGFRRSPLAGARDASGCSARRQGALAAALGYAYPPYDRSITAYTAHYKARFGPK